MIANTPAQLANAGGHRCEESGSWGRGVADFHNFNVVFRDDPGQRGGRLHRRPVPGIGGRVYPPTLAGDLYPEGIPIVDEADLGELIERERIERGDLRLLRRVARRGDAQGVFGHGPWGRLPLAGSRGDHAPSSKPVVAVWRGAHRVRQEPTSRRVGTLLRAAGLNVAQVRHPMPYGNLDAMGVQRFATLADIDAVRPTIEEREEYEAPVRMGMVMGRGRLRRDPAPGGARS